MITPREVWEFPTQRIARRVLVYDCVRSTNDLAAAHGRETSHDGLAFLAEVQTAGRGQHGRVWQAPPGASVLLSVLLFPPAPLRRAALLTAWAAVAVATTIHKTIGWQARIKWPNDILLSGRKVCGILIEQGQATVVGIGLNVQQNAADFAAAGLPEATSLVLQSGKPLDTHAIAKQLLTQLDDDYTLLLQGDFQTLEACWKWHIGLLGKRVTAVCQDGSHVGRLVELGFDGVTLQRDGGIQRTLPPERVQQLQLAPSTMLE